MQMTVIVILFFLNMENDTLIHLRRKNDTLIHLRRKIADKGLHK